MIEIKVCDECGKSPVLVFGKDSFYWCKHTGGLMCVSPETGYQMGWSAVLEDEIRGVISMHLFSVVAIESANRSISAKKDHH